MPSKQNKEVISLHERRSGGGWVAWLDLSLHKQGSKRSN